MQWLAHNARPRSCAAGSTTGRPIGRRGQPRPAVRAPAAAPPGPPPRTGRRPDPIDTFALCRSSSGRSHRELLWTKSKGAVSSHKTSGGRGQGRRRRLCYTRRRRGGPADGNLPDRPGAAQRRGRPHGRIDGASAAGSSARPCRHSRRPHRCLGARRGPVALLRRSERHPLFVGRRAARQPPRRSQRLAGAAHRRRDRRLRWPAPCCSSPRRCGAATSPSIAGRDASIW